VAQACITTPRGGRLSDDSRWYECTRGSRTCKGRPPGPFGSRSDRHEPESLQGRAGGIGWRGPRGWHMIRPMSYIDAHSHIWTPDVAHYPLAPGFEVADMKPRSFTAEELLKHCRPAGVERVNLIQMSFYGFDNRYMLDMIKMYPERFVGTAVIDHF